MKPLFYLLLCFNYLKKITGGSYDPVPYSTMTISILLASNIGSILLFAEIVNNSKYLFACIFVPIYFILIFIVFTEQRIKAYEIKWKSETNKIKNIYKNVCFLYILLSIVLFVIATSVIN
jgi:type IV secretory pathway VirB3-like protein